MIPARTMGVTYRHRMMTPNPEDEEMPPLATRDRRAQRGRAFPKETRRAAAEAVVFGGLHPNFVAERLDCTPQAVGVWVRKLREELEEKGEA